MKKLVFPLIALVIGFGTGYLIFKNPTPSNSFVFGPGSYEKTQSLIGQAIDSATAAKNIANYRAMVSTGGGLAGASGPFYGFYLDAASLKNILSDATIDGVSFYIGKDPYYATSASNYISIYYTGAKANLKAPPRFLNSKDVYEYVYPCPTACGTLAP